jgi:hypothetical protein
VKQELMSEVLLMPDGTVLAHNLTPAMAAVLHELNPADETIRQRVVTLVGKEAKKILPRHWDTEQSGIENPHAKISDASRPPAKVGVAGIKVNL